MIDEDLNTYSQTSNKINYVVVGLVLVIIMLLLGMFAMMYVIFNKDKAEEGLGVQPSITPDLEDM